MVGLLVGEIGGDGGAIADFGEGGQEFGVVMGPLGGLVGVGFPVVGVIDLAEAVAHALGGGFGGGGGGGLSGEDGRG